MPSEFDLAKQLGVSRATLREALRILEEENVITRRHGVGTFVNPKPIFTSGIEQLYSVTDMIKQGGMEPGTIFLSSKTQVPSEEDIHRFHAMRKRRLRLLKEYELPMGIQSSIVLTKFLIIFFLGSFHTMMAPSLIF